jgi:pentapeptide MXKDX repeat protein
MDRYHRCLMDNSMIVRSRLLWPAAIALAFAFAVPAAFADDMSKDSMSKDKGMKKETMSKDGMSKDNMSKDTMSKDKMSK